MSKRKEREEVQTRQKVKLSVTKKYKHAFFEKMSKDSIDSINFYDNHYPMRIINLMQMLLNDKFTKKKLKVEQAILQRNVALFKKKLNTPNSVKPSITQEKIEEYHTKYLEMHNLVLSMIYLKGLYRVLRIDNESQLLEPKFSSYEVTEILKEITQWLAYFDYKNFSLLTFLEYLTPAENAENNEALKIECRYHQKLLETEKDVIHAISELTTVNNCLLHEETGYDVESSLNFISLLLKIFDSLQLKDNVASQSSAEYLIKHFDYLKDINDMRGAIKSTKRRLSSLEKDHTKTSNTDELKTWSEYILNVKNEVGQVVSALDHILDLFKNITQTEESAFLTETLSEKYGTIDNVYQDILLCDDMIKQMQKGDSTTFEM